MKKIKRSMFAILKILRKYINVIKSLCRQDIINLLSIHKMEMSGCDILCRLLYNSNAERIRISY